MARALARGWYSPSIYRKAKSTRHSTCTKRRRSAHASSWTSSHLFCCRCILAHARFNFPRFCSRSCREMAPNKIVTCERVTFREIRGFNVEITRNTFAHKEKEHWGYTVVCESHDFCVTCNVMCGISCNATVDRRNAHGYRDKRRFNTD